MARFLIAVDDLLLHLRRRLAGGRDKARIRNGDESLGVDRLVRQRHEIARPNACLARDEQAAGRGLENGDADHVANAEIDLGRRTMVAEDTPKGSAGRTRPEC